MLFPSRPNQLLPVEGSLREAKLIEALFTVAPNSAVPSVTCWPLVESTVTLPARSGALLNESAAEVKSVRFRLTLADPFTSPARSTVTSPAML